MRIIVPILLVLTGSLSGMNSNIKILNPEKKQGEPTVCIVEDNHGPFIKIYGKMFNNIPAPIYKKINQYTKLHIDSCVIEKLNAFTGIKTLIITNCSINGIDSSFANRPRNLTIIRNKISKDVSDVLSEITEDDNVIIENNVVIEDNANNNVNN